MKTLKLTILLSGLALFLAFATSSCLNESQEGNLATVDSLLQKWDSLDSKISMIDTIAISESWHDFQLVLDTFKVYDSGDYNPEEWQLVKGFAEIKSALKFVVRKYRKSAASLKYSGNQLEALRNDIKGRKITEEEANSFLITESDELYRIEQEVILLVKNAEEGLQKKQLYTEPMLELIHSLKYNAQD